MEKQQSCAPGGESQSAQSAQPDQSRVEQIGTLKQVETLRSGILEYFYSLKHVYKQLLFLLIVLSSIRNT